MQNKLPKRHLNVQILSHTALVAVALIWGIAGPVVKVTLRDISVFNFLFFRFLLVCIVLIPFLFFELKKDPISKKDIPNVILLSILGQVSIVFVFLGLKYTTALDAAIIGVVSPILTFVAGSYFYNEKTTKMEKLGVTLAVIGTVFVVVEPILTENSATQTTQKIIGNIFLFLYQFSWPAYTIFGKAMLGKKSKKIKKTFKLFHIRKFTKAYKPSTLTAVSFYIGLAFFIPTAIWETQTESFTLNFTTPAVLGILYMSILSSIVAYSFYQWAVKNLEVQETSSYAYLNSIFTIPAAYLILGEIPTKEMVLGSMIIVLGVIIAEKFKS